MAQMGDLTTLPRVKDWLNTSGQAFPPGSDDKLARLITAASRFVQTYISRMLVPQDYAETRNGTGTSTLFLRNSPVVSVSSVTIGTTSVAKSPDPNSYGFLFDDTRVYLIGSFFPACPQNVQVAYAAGYQATAQAAVPANGAKLAAADLQGTSQVDGTFAGSWNCDRGVTLGGVALTRVASDPAAGQYAVKAEIDGTWSYYFSSSDSGTATVTYGYTPADVEQAVIELVGERYKGRNRIGEVSQNMGNGQVVTFSQKDMNDFVKDTLNQYKAVVPV